LFLVPGAIRVELDVQRRRQHFGGEFFCIVASCVLGFTERMMLAEVSIGVAIGRDSNPDRGGREAVRLTRGILSYYGKNHFTRMEKLQPLRTGDQLAIWRENGGNPN